MRTLLRQVEHYKKPSEEKKDSSTSGSVGLTVAHVNRNTNTTSNTNNVNVNYGTAGSSARFGSGGSSGNSYYYNEDTMSLRGYD